MSSQGVQITKTPTTSETTITTNPSPFRRNSTHPRNSHKTSTRSSNNSNSSSPEELARRLTLSTALALFQARPFTTQVRLVLTHPIETRIGTCTVGSAALHTGAIWAVICRPNWIAKLSNDWMAFSNRPMRFLVFLGATTYHFNPPVQRWDARYYAHKANRFWKSVNESLR